MEAPVEETAGEVPRPESPEAPPAEEVAARAPEVLWLTPDKPEDISVGRSRIADRLDDAGLEVTVRGTTPRTLVRSLREDVDYDVVVGTTRSGAIAGAVLSAVADTAFVVDHVDPIRQLRETHADWLAAVVRLLEDVCFWLADRVLFVYDEEETRVERFADVTFPTALGVDYDRVADPDPEAVAAARRRLDDHDLNEHVAVYVGGLEPIYHVEELLASVDHLDDWSLLVLGTGSLRDEVEAAAADGPDVVYPGCVPHEEIPGFLDLADVGVCLVDDPHTLKVLEYGAAGLPTVHLRGRSRDRFGDRLEYCDPDPESVARAIERARRRDAEPLEEFARVYDWDVIGRQYRRAILTAVS